MEQRVLVTGATTGIGAATVRRLLDRGHAVAGTARSKEDLEALDALGAEAFALELTEPASIARCAEAVLEAGDLYGLVNNAGIAVPGAVEDLTVEGWHHQLQVNLFGPIELTRRLAPALRSAEGRVVFVSSQIGLFPVPYWGAYTASKRATEAVADALRMELQPDRVRVSVVQPGPVRSAFQDRSIALAEQFAQASASAHADTYATIDRLARTGLLARRPDAVARAVVRALRARWPRARYPVNRLTYVGLQLARVLPTSVRDRLVHWGTRL